MAKDTKPEQKPEVVPDPAAEVPVGPPKSYRLQIALGFVCLILFQMIVLWLLLPSPKQVADIGATTPGGNSFDESGNTVPPELDKKKPLVEKQVNEGKAFKLSDSRGESTVKLTVVVHLQIRKEDERKFDKRFLECANEVNDRITTVLQGSTGEDRNEVGLVAIKERMKKMINEVLGKPWVQNVFLADWNVESS